VKRVDQRGIGLLLTVVLVVGGGAWLAHGPAPHEPQRLNAPAPTPVSQNELQQRFDEAVLLLHGRQHERAVQAWNRVLELAPRLTEAHVNMGFALLGLQQTEAARRAFERAIELRPEQANAYYGLALSHEAGQDLELALGAMRTYLHLARGEGEAHLARARSALWEWESQIAEKRRSTSARP
jgi:tetratricopeptide (TPR) repeat protein